MADRALRSSCLAAPLIAMLTSIMGISSASSAVAAGDVSRGESVAAVCKSCHSFERKGPSWSGPPLWGIVGSRHARQEDFAYSSAMMSLRDKVWDLDALDQYLLSASEFIPGTSMTFYGLKHARDRRDVLAYLYSLRD